MKKIFTICFALLAFLAVAQNKINRYEYWFDSDYASRVTTGITPAANYTLSTAVPTTSLSPGLHVIHIRFRDDSLKWSSTVSQFFQKVPQPSSTTVNITGYEYWYDNNYSGRVYTALAPQQNAVVASAISAASLSDGLHLIHIRFKDSAGQWSSVVSQFFHKTQSSASATREIVAYQYWYDSDFGSAVTNAAGPAANIALVSPISAASISNGLHVMHIRFKDNTGQWSSVVSQFFHKSEASASSTVNITAYEYWFDSDYGSAVTQTVSAQQNINLVSTVPATALPDGLHLMHIRFQDNTGKWSSVVSQFFHKNGISPSLQNQIVAYRYWFDTADSAMVTQTVSPQTDLDLNTAVSMVMIPKGVHTVHFQFRDTLGLWSSITTDTLTKLPLPLAVFSANDTIFCDSGTVAFMDHSIDGDTYYWEFGDGDTSSAENPLHLYHQPGLYNVSLTVTDTASGQDSSSTYAQYIRVYDTPSPVITSSPNDSICAGQQVTISADTGAVYNWNTGSTSQSISVNSTGDYWTTVSNILYPACSVNSDTVHITIMPLPNVNLGNDSSICQGTQILLDATNAGASYNWSTGATTPTVLAGNAAAYWVSVTSAFGCVNSDTVTIGIDPLPVAVFNYSNTNMTYSFADQSQYGTGWHWDFGDSNSDTQQNPSHTYASAGTYTVTLIVTNACSSDTSTQVIVVTGLEMISALDGMQVNVFPNPATDLVNISFSIEDETLVYIGVYDVSGKLVTPVLSTAAIPSQVQNAILNTSNLSDGVYFVRLSTTDKSVTRRLVIAR